MDIQTELQLIGKPYQPNFPAEAVSGLGRQEMMDVLLAAEHIAETLEICNTEIAASEEKLKAGQATADALRTKLSKSATRKIWIITIIGIVIGAVCSDFSEMFMIVSGVVTFLIAFAKISSHDLEIHQAENDLAADNYIAEHIVPLQQQLSDLSAIKEDILNNGRRDWAIGVVGEDLFYSACIHDLYQLIKTRRADNLKEALNKYDDEQYKARMQEIQQAARQAAETAAEEAKKQTGQLKSIKWNTAWTGWNTSRIKHNTKKR